MLRLWPPTSGELLSQAMDSPGRISDSQGEIIHAAKNWASKFSIQIASAGRTEKRGALAACRSSRARSGGVAAGTWARAAYRDQPFTRRNGHERGDESDAEL